jgi:hypothetical protein
MMHLKLCTDPDKWYMRVRLSTVFAIRALVKWPHFQRGSGVGAPSRSYLLTDEKLATWRRICDGQVHRAVTHGHAAGVCCGCGRNSFGG